MKIISLIFLVCATHNVAYALQSCTDQSCTPLEQAVMNLATQTQTPTDNSGGTTIQQSPYVAKPNPAEVELNKTVAGQAQKVRTMTLNPASQQYFYFFWLYPLILFVIIVSVWISSCLYQRRKKSKQSKEFHQDEQEEQENESDSDNDSEVEDED